MEAMAEHFCPHMEINKIVTHPDGYEVLIVRGKFLDDKYGRVTNWWTWRRVNEDGTLGEEESGYGW